MIQTKISKYRILEKIGEGGMGTVFKALDEELGRPVAIKILHAHLLKHNQIIERFKGEARTLAKLNHPNLATLHNFIQYEDTYCMVMEYVDGKTLAEILREQSSLSLSTCLNFGKQILNGIQHAHDHGVVHRDIKPSNIIITGQGKVKVMDFGIARMVGSQRLTRTGTIIGTLEYMAPEQLKGEEGESVADIYAIGTLLFELLSGQLPFEGETEFDLIQKKVHQKPNPLHQANKKLPRLLTRTIHKALHANPNKRFSSASHFANALSSLENPNESEINMVTPTFSAPFKNRPTFGSWSKYVIGITISLLSFFGTKLWLEPKIEKKDTYELSQQNVEKEVTPVFVANTKSIPIPTQVTMYDHSGAEFRSEKDPRQFFIDSLLDLANYYYQIGQWLQPDKENAHFCCLEIQKWDESHLESEELITRMASEFELEGDIWEQKQNYEKARIAYESSLLCKWNDRVLTKKNQIRLKSSQAEHAKKKNKRQPIVQPKVVKKSNENELQKPKQTDLLETTVIKKEIPKTSLRESAPVEKRTMVHLFSGTEVNVSLDKRISSEGGYDKNSPIAFNVEEAVVVDGKIIIKKGSMVYATLTQIKSLRKYKKAMLEIAVTHVEAVNGDKLPVKSATFRLIGKKNRPVSCAAGQWFTVRIHKDHAISI